MKITISVLFILVTSLATLSFRYHPIIEIQDDTVEFQQIVSDYRKATLGLREESTGRLEWEINYYRTQRDSLLALGVAS